MLDHQTRVAILKLHHQGHGSRKIARDLDVSRTSVREVIRRGEAEVPQHIRPHCLENQLENIRSLYAECKGNIVRVQEELECRHQITASYSTLTRFCRAYRISCEAKQPVQRIQTDPGEEMQHDTSPYTITIGGQRLKRHCASLVLGYSRMLYIRFYSRFDRFHCKMFLTEAFQFMGGVCRRCVVDNTHVIIVCGTGCQAQVSAEMEAFERRFHFQFLAHELGDANRSGKVERPFRYIEGNFLAGRHFKNDDDLNQQALAWLEKKAQVRRLRELKASPVELFAAEKPHLVSLPLHIPAIYRDYPRDVDSYGYVHLHGMRYSAPREILDKAVTARETKDEVILLIGHEEWARHRKLTETDDRTQSTLPEHEHRRHRRRPSRIPQETHLKTMGAVMEEYLDALKTERRYRYLWSLKKLYALSCQYKTEVFLETIGRAHHHRLFDVNRIEAMLLETIAHQDFLLPLGSEDYADNPEFQKGAETPPADLGAYTVDIEPRPPEEDDA